MDIKFICSKWKPEQSKSWVVALVFAEYYDVTVKLILWIWNVITATFDHSNLIKLSSSLRGHLHQISRNSLQAFLRYHVLSHRRCYSWHDSMKMNTSIIFAQKTAQLKQTIISKYLTVRSCWKLRDHKTVLSSGELHTSSNSTKRKRSSKEQLPRYWTSDSGVDLLSYIPLKVELYIQRLITD